jgi:hypothetical protein
MDLNVKVYSLLIKKCKFLARSYKDASMLLKKG